MRNIYKTFSLVIILISVFSSCSKKGCTDPMSLAYDVEASKDDGSCTYPENVKKSLVIKVTATWCPPCGDWGAEYVNNIYNDFSGNAEVISVHDDSDFGVDIGYNLMSILNPTGVPSFYLGLDPMGNSGYGNVSDLISADLSTTNQASMAVEHSILDGNMLIRVQSQLENQFSGDNCYLALYIMEDGQVAPQQVSGVGEVVDYVHNHTLRTEANGSTFGMPITFEDGKNLTEVTAALVPDPIWNHGNLYVVAVIWQQNGSTYDFINLAR